MLCYLPWTHTFHIFRTKNEWYGHTQMSFEIEIEGMTVLSKDWIYSNGWEKCKGHQFSLSQILGWVQVLLSLIFLSNPLSRILPRRTTLFAKWPRLSSRQDRQVEHQPMSGSKYLCVVGVHRALKCNKGHWWKDMWRWSINVWHLRHILEAIWMILDIASWGSASARLI